jgi:hypothetical protein
MFFAGSFEPVCYDFIAGWKSQHRQRVETAIVKDCSG